ncbi:Ig-like domain-containing protein [Pseudomonas gingeri]|uniref:Ig-like domain-containing protein n=2 Tax=Pseudomonas gingeri TaxID=117681 RepID=A0A7Y7XY44_9PSED|nr:Ig-like domain-containing protein [Pseudomonas gingeri]NWC13237.1 Ig-like domain-containing protein [Pseudomonas gingeri]
MNDSLDPTRLADNPLPVRTFDLSQPEPITPVPFNELDLYIPNMTAPVVGFDGGINRAALDAHRDKGLQCILLPYRPMAENDFIELFCRDTVTPVAFHTVSDIEAANNAQISLFIPRARLPDGPADPVFFHLTRVSGNDDETARFRLKVDTVSPGGRNPVASTYYNENLAMPVFPQDLIDFGVGEGDIIAPVPVRIDFYPAVSNPAPDINRAVRDRIRLSIGGHIIEHRVTEGEIESTDPITLWVNTGDWQKIGSGEHVCEYEVVDEVGNYSDGWSPAQLLEVRLDDQAEPLLYEPYVEESDEHNELDADALEGADATIVVVVHRDDFAVGDTIQIKLNSKTSTGLPVIRYIDHPVAANEVGRSARIPWDNAEIRSLIKGRVQISYKRIRPSAPERGSRSVIVYITGTQVGTGLPAPTVEGAPGDVLPPDIAFLIVNIKEYVGQDPFDRVTLVLDGTYANGRSYYKEVDDIAGTGDIVFHLQNGPNGDIARLEGGTLRLYYWVENERGKFPSEDLLLDVGQPQASLPPVEVDEAPPPDHIFDPEVSPFDARVLVKANVDIIENDIINLHAEGSVAGGSAPVFVFPVTATWVGRDLPFTLKREYILPNLDRSMHLYYTLARAGARPRFSHPFIMKVGGALDLPMPHVLETTEPGGHLLNPIHAQHGATIRVRYDGMKNSDNIQAFWKGVAGSIGSPDIVPKPGNESQQYVDFDVPDTTVAINIGKQVEVSYAMTRAGTTTPSAPLNLTLQSLPGSGLPPLQILEAGSGQVDVNGTVTFRVDAWPFYRQGDRVWLALESDNPDGTLNRLPIWTASPISAAEFGQKFLTRVITSNPDYATWLRALAHGSELRVTFKVVFGGGSNEADALTFPVRSYIVRNAVQVEAPTITSVKNAANGEITNGSTVVTTTVTVTGTAPNGQQVQIRDVNNVMGTANANGSGVWTSSALTVTNKAYSINARGVYDSNPVSTPPRTFTVTALVAPSLTSVKDPKGAEVEQGTTTRERVFTLTGVASNLQRVQIEDGNGPSAQVLGTAAANASGIWTFTTSTRPTGERRFYVRSLYHPSTVFSNVRTFNVTDEVKPNITGVHTSSGLSVPHNGTTNQTSLTLSGTATPNSTIEVRNGGDILLSTGVNGSNAWSDHIHNLSEKKYDLVAKIVGGTLSSDIRTFTVQLHPPLAMNTSPMVLNGKAIRTSLGWPQTGNDFLNNTATRTPTAGSGSYTYSSNNISIAPVSETGKVVGLRNGSARITVRDERTGQTLGYDVTVSNVWELNINNSRLASYEANTWRINRRGSNLPQSDMDLLKRYYTSPFPRSNLLQNAYWCDTSGAGCSLGQNLIYSSTTGNVSCSPTSASSWGAFCITEYN